MIEKTYALLGAIVAKTTPLSLGTTIRYKGRASFLDIK